MVSNRFTWWPCYLPNRYSACNGRPRLFMRQLGIIVHPAVLLDVACCRSSTRSAAIIVAEKDWSRLQWIAPLKKSLPRRWCKAKRHQFPLYQAVVAYFGGPAGAVFAIQRATWKVKFFSNATDRHPTQRPEMWGRGHRKLCSPMSGDVRGAIRRDFAAFLGTRKQRPGFAPTVACCEYLSIFSTLNSHGHWKGLSRAGNVFVCVSLNGILATHSPPTRSNNYLLQPQTGHRMAKVPYWNGLTSPIEHDRSLPEPDNVSCQQQSQLLPTYVQGKQSVHVMQSQGLPAVPWPPAHNIEALRNISSQDSGSMGMSPCVLATSADSTFEVLYVRVRANNQGHVASTLFGSPIKWSRIPLTMTAPHIKASIAFTRIVASRYT